MSDHPKPDFMSHALLRHLHDTVRHTDEVAAQLADHLGLDPAGELITEAVWNTSDLEEGLAILGVPPLPSTPEEGS